jgi:hypothetical protein
MQVKQKSLAFLAKQHVGINASNTEIVNNMRKAVDGVAAGEPWCACFVQYLAKRVDEWFADLGLAPEATTLNTLPQTESTQSMWYRSIAASRSDWPTVGSVVVWRLKENESLGHCGIVIAVTDIAIVTVEGNTSFAGMAGATELERNGRGIWQKTRPLGNIPGFDKLGYLSVWP